MKTTAALCAIMVGLGACSGGGTTAVPSPVPGPAPIEGDASPAVVSPDPTPVPTPTPEPTPEPEEPAIITVEAVQAHYDTLTRLINEGDIEQMWEIGLSEEDKARLDRDVWIECNAALTAQVMDMGFTVSVEVLGLEDVDGVTMATVRTILSSNGQAVLSDEGHTFVKIDSDGDLVAYDPSDVECEVEK